MLDSSVLIAAERGRFALTSFFRAHANETFVISAITAAELLHGVERALTTTFHAEKEAFVESLLSELPVLSFDLAAARKHAELWAALEKAG